MQQIQPLDGELTAQAPSNNFIISMVRKNKVKKMTVEKIMELVAKEVNGDDLKVYNDCLLEKNQSMAQKQQNLLKDIEQSRKQIEKVLREMNEGIKDRMQLKSKVVMDRNSRPRPQDIGHYSSLFTYFEKQCSHMRRNSQDISHFSATICHSIDMFQAKASMRADCSDLDEQYYQLNLECAKQIEVRDALEKERQNNLRHYSSIAGQIQSARVEYELVEDRIREKERELIQLQTYFNTRTQEDKQALAYLRASNSAIQEKIMQTQSAIQGNYSRCSNLMILQQECLGPKLAL